MAAIAAHTGRHRRSGGSDTCVFCGHPGRVGGADLGYCHDPGRLVVACRDVEACVRRLATLLDRYLIRARYRSRSAVLRFFQSGSPRR